ncbi:DUF485 domain-containing protein [Kyrpidia spormannii]|uniref:Uncharacterized protein n=2 Tax=Kyrpidia spormannii TaxID=2055160 RepID=A0ACA8ZBA0_9BACL|nr:DUF485 domain-containing protein [Kyrpidia spormannii]CAB3393561.1 conserved protein of unknown function [Kyrpidia spormannii]CAB3394483.1 conserved protein of unknown function [Kyrpidia spormannii]
MKLGTKGSDEWWEHVYRLPAFQDVVRQRKRFLAGALTFFLVYFLLLYILSGWARTFLATPVGMGMNIGFLFVLSQFIVIWVLCWLYLRWASKLDELTREVTEKERGALI